MGDFDFAELQELAARVGIHVTYLWYILNDRRRPSRFVAKRLEEETGIKASAWIWPEEHRNTMIERYQRDKEASKK